MNEDRQLKRLKLTPEQSRTIGPLIRYARQLETQAERWSDTECIVLAARCALRALPQYHPSRLAEPIDERNPPLAALIGGIKYALISVLSRSDHRVQPTLQDLERVRDSTRDPSSKSVVESILSLTRAAEAERSLHIKTDVVKPVRHEKTNDTVRVEAVKAILHTLGSHDSNLAKRLRKALDVDIASLASKQPRDMLWESTWPTDKAILSEPDFIAWVAEVNGSVASSDTRIAALVQVCVESIEGSPHALISDLIALDLARPSSKTGSPDESTPLAQFGEGLRIDRVATEEQACLNVHTYAEAIAELLQGADGDFTFGLFGHWGRGKTYLMKLVQRRLESEHNYAVVNFSAWAYPHAPMLWAHLYEEMAKKPKGYWFWNRWQIAFLFNRSLYGIWAFLPLFTVPPVLGYLVSISFEVLQDWMPTALDSELLGIATAIASFLLLGHQLVSGIWTAGHRPLARWFQKLSSYTRIPTHDDKLGLQALIGRDLRALLDAWLPNKRRRFENLRRAYCKLTGIPSRVLLVVDDLDRCDPVTMLEVIEGLAQFIQSSGIQEQMQVAMLVDEDVLAQAILKKYGGVATGTNAQIVGENIDKLFVAYLRLQELSEDECLAVLANHLRSLGAEPSRDFENFYGFESKQVETSSSSNASGSRGSLKVPESPQRPTTSSEQTSKTDTKTPPIISTDEAERLLTTLGASLAESKTDFARDRLSPRALRSLVHQYMLARHILWFRGESASPEKIVEAMKSARDYGAADSTDPIQSVARQVTYRFVDAEPESKNKTDTTG